MSQTDAKLPDSAAEMSCADGSDTNTSVKVHSVDRSSYMSAVPAGHTRLCTDPWTFAQVFGGEPDYNGEADKQRPGLVRPCCFSGLVLGYISDEASFADIYNGEHAKRLRKQLLTGDLDEYCSICNMKSVGPTADLKSTIKALKYGEQPGSVAKEPIIKNGQQAWSGFPRAYVTRQSLNLVDVVNTQANASGGIQIQVGKVPTAVAVSPSGTTVYVVNHESDSVSVIDSCSNRVIATIRVGARPREIAISSDGTTGYVTNHADGTVSIFATRTHRVTKTCPVGASPWGIRLSPDGQKAYITNLSLQAVSILNVRDYSVEATLQVGGSPTGLALLPDGSKLYIVNNGSGNVSVMDTKARKIVDTIAVGSAPWGIAVSPNGRKAYISNEQSHSVSVLDTLSDKLVKTIPVGNGPRGIILTPDGSKLYTANTGEGTCSVVDTATHTLLATIPGLSHCQEIAATAYQPSEIRRASSRAKRLVRRVASGLRRRLAAY